MVSGIYHLQSFSGVGKGVSDAVDVKKEMDDLHSQTMAYIKAHGTPSYGYNKDIVSEEQARNIGKPRKMIPFDFTNAPDGVNSINQAVQAILPSNPAAAVFQYGQQLENFLQMSFQVTAFSDGLPGVDNKTATGAPLDHGGDVALGVVLGLRQAAETQRGEGCDGRAQELTFELLHQMSPLVGKIQALEPGLMGRKCRTAPWGWSM